MDARHRKHREVCKQRIAMHAEQRRRKIIKNAYQIKIAQPDGLYLSTCNMSAPESAALQRFFTQVNNEAVVMANCFYANGEAVPHSMPARH